MIPLKPVALNDPRISVRGALQVSRTAERLRFRRLPEWTRALSPEPAFDLMASMASGVRLVFDTTSRVLEIEALETGVQIGAEARRTARIEVIAADMRVSADLTEGHTVVTDGAGVKFVPGVSRSVRFDLPFGMKTVTVWLPQSAMIDVLGLRVEASADLDAAQPPSRTWAHYGSSISHGMEAAGPSRTWPAIVARAMELELFNLGLAGQCHLDGFVARVLRDGAFDVISMEIGVNVVGLDTMRRRVFSSAVEGFLDTIREVRPATPIIIITPFYSPLLETTPGPLVRGPRGTYERPDRPFALEDGALTMGAARTAIAAVVKQRLAGGDENLWLVDGLSLFGAADVSLMPDDLHPNAEGHERIGRRFLDAIASTRLPFRGHGEFIRG